jgi:peptidoglycan hydrolase-like protein with peptidoglycan-binding domain
MDSSLPGHTQRGQTPDESHPTRRQPDWRASQTDTLPESYRPLSASLTGLGGASDTGAMTLQVPRLPFSLDPLMAEAKRRARQRRTLIALGVLGLAGLAGGLPLAFRSPGGGSTNGGLTRIGANAGQPLLRRGSRGVAVASWQRAMNQWLSSSGIVADRQLRARLGGGLKVDGVFDANTVAATKQFQREGQLPATGTVGLADWKAWIGANVTQPNGAEGVGSKGYDFGGAVGWWQISVDRWLRQHHRLQIAVDSFFGPQTRTATGTFQRALHLASTGIVDQRTWTAAERLGLTHFP